MPEHFIVHGQTFVAAGGVDDDPTPNWPGTIGEIASLPYIVPDGKRLVLLSQGIEGTREPLAALFPWLGNYAETDNTEQKKTAYRVKHSLFTVQSTGGSREHCPRFILPAGTIMHVRITNGALVNGYTLAWYVRGVLLSDEEDAAPWLK